MNDFSELESELKKLRPLQPSAGLIARIEQAIVDLTDEEVATEKIIRPSRFKVSWVSLGAGLAAAAVFLIFARIDVDRVPKQTQVAQNTPAPATKSTTSEKSGLANSFGVAPATFIPDGSTQVVYNTRDEGLHFANGYEEPLRQVRYNKRETLQWRNPATGASLRVSYPSEEVVLTPVSAQ